MNRYRKNNLKITEKYYEKGKSKSIDKLWSNGLTKNETNLDGSVFLQY